MQLTETFALELDQQDPLQAFRSQFFIPQTEQGKPKFYFCGNSLGLQPKTVPNTMQRELALWANLGVDGHFAQDGAWYTYVDPLREQLTSIVGAAQREIIIMNALTVNLHLMFCSFYQPKKSRFKILIMEPTFPSDRYAVQSHLAVRGYDPQQALLTWMPRADTHIQDISDLENILKNHGEEIALIWLEGVNYLTGQALDIEKITQLGHRYGCMVGWDLAHAVGNVMLKLHAWQVDFAVWCSYKYLNAGPGATGGCFVHEEHVAKPLLQFAGWWGNDPKTRFKFENSFTPYPGADRWQISNAPIFSIAPLKDSLAIFAQATMPKILAKSQQLTQYLRFLLESIAGFAIRIITPAMPNSFGCQLSLLLEHDAIKIHEQLLAANIVCDLRENKIMRLAPVPLYNSFHEVWQVYTIIADVVAKHSG